MPTGPDVPPADPTAVDLADPRLYGSGSPEPVWAALRARSPLHRNTRSAGAPFWAVLGHAAAVEVLGDPGTFGSERGMRLDADPAAVAAAAGRLLIVSDPPRHARIRKVMSGAFTPRMVRRLEDTMRATAAEIVAAAVRRGEHDFAPAAARLPVSVIADLLGVPRADWDHMLDRTTTAFGTADPTAAARAHTDLFVYFHDLLERRRRDPGEDVLSALAHGSIDGRPLTDEEIILNCDGLISGGNETTRHAVLGGLSAFAADPAQWRRLRADRSLLDTAVAEILRYTSPAMHVLRTAARDTVLAGTPVAAGERVAVWLPAANRDGAVFHDPETFDVGRRPNRHLAFAQGPHYCLGAALATAELTAMFTELLHRVATVEPAGAPSRLASNLIRGFAALPVRLIAGAAP